MQQRHSANTLASGAAHSVHDPLRDLHDFGRFAPYVLQSGIGSTKGLWHFRGMAWTAIGWRGASFLVLLSSSGCGSSASDARQPTGAAGASTAGAGGAEFGGGAGATTRGGASSAGAGQNATGGAGASTAGGAPPMGGGPSLSGCAILPTNHLFNTPIASLPAHGSSAAFMSAVGTRNIHLDLGTSIDPAASDYYGIPYNVVHSTKQAWVKAAFSTTDTANLDWDPTGEADCASGASHTLTSPCTPDKAPAPLFPLPETPLIEGGIVTDPAQPYGDHHLLALDTDTCTLWELYHVYPDPKGGWDIFGAAFFDLKSNALRPAGWTSADAAGFPILPLLLRADEASSGVIRHALRFTIESSHIRRSYTWPARHLTSNGTTSTELPPMGQAFRIKASYAIPANFNTQSKAILQALKTYGMYLADGGSAMYIQGEPSADWQGDTFDQVQSVSSSQFEAVDLSPIEARAGFDPNSAAVP